MIVRRCSWLLLLLALGCTSPTVSLATRKLADAGVADPAREDESEDESEHEDEDEDEECELPFLECDDPPP